MSSDRYEFIAEGRELRYVDSDGVVTVRLTACENGMSNYSAVLRDRVLEGNSLDDFVEQLPDGASLQFEVSMPFILNTGEPVPGALRVEAGMEARQSVYRCRAMAPQLATMEPACASDLESAFDQLRVELRPIGSLQCCLACKWSDFEPNTTIGNLYCLVGDKARYSRAASATDAMTRKYGIWGRHKVPVDEFYRCEQFEIRPPMWGYRG